MVTQYGMTETLGAIKFGQERGEPFLGREIGHERDYSEQVAAVVDDEVRTLIETAHQEAFDILAENRAVLDALVVELLEKETLDRAEVDAVFAAATRLEPRPAWTGSPSRAPSSEPPVLTRKEREAAGSNGHVPVEQTEPVASRSDGTDA
jgi:cell division protease FtsH